MANRTDLLNKAAAGLSRFGIETARLDARLLLQHALSITHADLIADPYAEITHVQANLFYELLERRKMREPVSRILGYREFYGLEFSLSPDTLDPRPDTETLVEEALSHQPHSILDLGTGSGAIAISLLKNLTEAQATACDISPGALITAAENAARHGVADRLKLINSNWYENISGQFAMIVSNPPYIQDATIQGLSPEVRQYDPHLALAGGPDGLQAYRAIILGAKSHLLAGGRLILEIGQGQQDDISALLRAESFAGIQQLPDLSGNIRVISAKWRE